MHLVTFIEGGERRIGLHDTARGEIVDLAQAAPELPRDMIAFIALGEAGLAAAQRALTDKSARLPLAQLRLAAPIPRPVRNVFCVGKNYREHAQELQKEGSTIAARDAIPEVPIFFTKATSTVIGPGDPIPAWLDPTRSTDYEGELAVVIGPGGRGIARADAMRHVYGYTIINDATARVLQGRHQQWFLGKSIDGFCPMGPAVVTTDSVPDPGQLRVQTRVNGELRQNATVSGLIFDIPALIETLSRTLTLEPGDLIATGTPAGVGMGFKPPKYLKKGDVVAITIEPIGTLENPVA
ncbi:MAG TPA: fumarylacetoacetate hydrolase family protein [Candidatus Methylomirabilis sp.]|nr:fumarylacetoacetate hydrolase family protein [Candidatus Methylomirabilis sp.]